MTETTPLQETPALPYREILAAVGLSGVLIAGTSYSLLSLYDATQLSYGVVFAIINLAFYTFLTWLIFIKKNIAWIVLLTVIKYAILIIAIYLVWSHGKAFLFVVGMLSELILTALMWLIIKQVLLKRT